MDARDIHVKRTGSLLQESIDSEYIDCEMSRR